MLRSMLVLLCLPASCLAAPIPVLDGTAGSPGLPVAQALADLGDRVQVTSDDLSGPPAGGVLILDGASDLSKLTEGSLEAFVAAGGGLLIAGLADSLPHTGALWRALGDAAIADVPSVDLFPDDSGNWMWIGPQGDETPDHIRYIRRAFEVARPVKRAVVRCTADNLYWMYLNGEEAGYSWSWYDHELWDITQRVREGRNVLAFKARNVDGPGGFFAQLAIEYEDGMRELIVSDESFKFSIAEQDDWAAPDFDDSSWGTAKEITPMAQHTRIRDGGVDAKGPIDLQGPHPILNAIADRFGTAHTLRGVTPRASATVLASVQDRPVVLCGEYGRGRVVLVDAVQRPGGIGGSDLSDDLLGTAILWLGHQEEGLSIAEVTYPPARLVRGEGARVGCVLDSALPAADGELHAALSHDGKPALSLEFPLRAGQAMAIDIPGATLPDAAAEGSWELTLTAKDAAKATVFRRDVLCEVTNPVNLALSIPSNRHVVAEGNTLQVEGEVGGEFPPGSVVSSAIVDPWGRELAAPEPAIAEGVYTWTYEVPELAEGQYRLTTTVTAGAEVVDTSAVTFHVVPRLDLQDFYSTTMRLSPFTTLNRAAIEREIDDIIAHGFNTLTFSGRRLAAAPGSPYDYAEDYAQRRGMAVAYSFQGNFSLLNRDALPPVSVFSPEYKEALAPRIAAAVETCRMVPRLLNVQGYMDEPFQVSGKTFDDRPPAQEEFRRRYGIDMPTREQAMADPALWLKYIDFWSDCFAAGWRQSYAMVKEAYPDFWVELTHDSHCTFGAAGRNFKSFWAVDDVFHWGAPFDSVNYDIYPYLSTDFRTGKFGENRLPRIAGMHMAFAQMRNLAYTYDKKLGFWLESGWGEKLAPTSPLRDAIWSPRELTYTALAAGCDYLNTFWGIPEDKRWWETYQSVMPEVQSVAPLLTRSRVPRAKAAFLFPRTQHVLLQEEYWNVMVALEAFRQAYGELDCIHEEQLAQGLLDQYGTLVLFDIHLLKRQDAETIRDWVAQGGRLVADEVPSLDEGKGPLGIFEPVFGVQGTAEVAEGAIDVPGTNAQLWGRRGYEGAGAMPIGPGDGGWAPLLGNTHGRGQTFLLNFPVKDCYLDALVRQDANGAAEALLDVLRRAAGNDEQPANVTSSNPKIEAAIRQTPQGTALLLVINHESEDDTTTVTLPHLPAGGVVRDMVGGERLQSGERYSMTLQCPWGQTRLIGIFPSDPRGLTLQGLRGGYAPGDAVEYALTVGGETIRGNYLLQVTVTGPDGHEYQSFSALTCTEDAACPRTFALPVNAQPGKWTVKAESLWDGAVAEGSFEVG